MNPSPLAAVHDAQLLLRSGRVGMTAAVLEQLPSLINLALAAAETAAYDEGYAAADPRPARWRSEALGHASRLRGANRAIVQKLGAPATLLLAAELDEAVADVEAGS